MTAHSVEKCSPITGTLRYLHTQLQGELGQNLLEPELAISLHSRVWVYISILCT